MAVAMVQEVIANGADRIVAGSFTMPSQMGGFGNPMQQAVS
jgi:hypothetical protein